MNSSRTLVDRREINERHLTVHCCCMVWDEKKRQKGEGGMEAQVQHCLGSDSDGGGSSKCLQGLLIKQRHMQRPPSIMLCGELIYIKYNWGQKRGRTKWDLCLPSLLQNGSNMPHLLAENVLLMWTSCRVFRQQENAPGIWSNHCLYL